MNPRNQTTNPALRLALLAGVAVVLLAALLVRLWFLQVLAGDRFASLAEDNRLRYVVLDAPRGHILASDGSVLVRNRPAQTISVDRAQIVNGAGLPRDEQAELVLKRLGDLLDLDADDLLRRINTRRYSPFRAVPVAEDVAPEIVFALNEHAELYPGVTAEVLPLRSYPEGQLAAHLVGYVGEISARELDLDRYASYRAGELIGWAGLERSWERDLRGTEGLRELEVTARGAVLNVIAERAPVRGSDLLTSLDLELQHDVERLLAEGIIASRDVRRRDGRLLPSPAGAAVVLDPRDGSVVAMASFPTYDPAEFIGGVSQTYWSALQSPESEYPLINRAVQSSYPPGSVFKIITGAAMMEAGILTPTTRLNCPSSYRVGTATFKNWNTSGEGFMDLSTALMRSCDTFFYDLAYTQWVREQREFSSTGSVDEVMPRVAAAFGVGRKVGIDLPVETAGQIPSRAWRTEYWESTRAVTCAQAEEQEPGYYKTLLAELCVDGGRWRPGDAVNSSIGQGDVLTSPLQIATAYAAVANGGTLFQPQIGQELRDASGALVREVLPVELAKLPLDAAEIREIQLGLEMVVMGSRGTARGAFSGFPLDEFPVAGKTGTAEAGANVPFAWFASYAPVDAPRYVVVVAVEEGGGGSQTAAPIVRNIYDAIVGRDTAFVAGPDDVD